MARQKPFHVSSSPWPTLSLPNGFFVEYPLYFWSPAPLCREGPLPLFPYTLPFLSKKMARQKPFHVPPSPWPTFSLLNGIFVDYLLCFLVAHSPL